MTNYIQVRDRDWETISVQWTGYDDDLTTALQGVTRRCRWWSPSERAWIVKRDAADELWYALEPWSHRVLWLDPETSYLQADHIMSIAHRVGLLDPGPAA